MSTAAALLDALRAEAKPALWSNGVKLARAGVVTLESQDESERVLRVKAPGRTVAWTVVLYPKDSAWECDCPCAFDPCDHCVAAAITLKEDEEKGGVLAKADARLSRLGYRFARTDGGLCLRRVLVDADGAEAPLETSVAALLLDPAKARSLRVEQADLHADRLLSRPVRSALPADRLDTLLAALAPAKDVALDGLPISISDVALRPRAVVEDDGPGVAVHLHRGEGVTEFPAPGVALADATLYRLAEQASCGARWELLPRIQRFGAAQLGELASRGLKDLKARYRLELRTARLPDLDDSLKPRILLTLTQLDGGLEVLPTLVYGAPPHARVDGARLVHLQGAAPVRDEAQEQRLVHRLRETLSLVPGRRLSVQGPELAPFVDKLRRFDGDVAGSAAAALTPAVTLTPRLVVTGELPASGAPQVGFGLRFEVAGGDGQQSVEAADVVRAWQQGLGLVPLLGGGFAPLPQAFLDAHGAVLAGLLAARQEDGRVANHALPALADLCQALDHPPPPGLDRLAALAQGFESLPPPKLPKDLTATLRPYQVQGVAWLQFLQSAGLGGVLADDMGLGKTLQAACVLGAGSLVVCPTSVLPNWKKELQRFRPGVTVNVFHGPGRALQPDVDVTLTTWALLRLDAELLTERRWTSVVLDEAQAMKNPDSQVARAAYKLQGDFRLLLSGTPVENRLEELWSLFHCANPGLLGGRRDFEDTFARPIAEGRPGAAQALRQKTRPFILRRLKKDVAKDLPPKSETVLHVTLDERERVAYDAVLQATREDVVKRLGEGLGVMQALEALLRLRQAACHTGLLPGQEAKTSSKVRALVEALETAAADGHKALVFSQWTGLLDFIEPALTEAGVAFTRLDGSTPDRGKVVDAFQADDGPPVMLVSLKAGGTGLNLTAADHVFLVDPWWNPAVEQQAADRAHRIGQTRPVLVYRLVALDTVEERILELQDKKRALFEAALGGGDVAGGLTKDDLLALFQ